MKKLLILSTLTIILCFLTSFSLQAQFNPYKSNTNLASVGVGLSNWGIPIYGRIVFPVEENITIGGGFAYRSYDYSSYWNVSTFSITGRGNYHFNELLEIPNEWDVYAGLDLTFYITDHEYVGPPNIGLEDWNRGGPDGVGLSLHAGGRYFLKRNLALNAELNGGSISGLLFGVTFLL